MSIMNCSGVRVSSGLTEVALNSHSLKCSVSTRIVSQKYGNTGPCSLSVLLSQNQNQIFSSAGSKPSRVIVKMLLLQESRIYCSYILV